MGKLKQTEKLKGNEKSHIRVHKSSYLAEERVQIMQSNNLENKRKGALLSFKNTVENHVMRKRVHTENK